MRISSLTLDGFGKSSASLRVFDDPKVGFVQSRWSYHNREESALTRGQAVLLDKHFLIEQPARCQNGLFFNFNGSGGIWRKTCLVDAGGWQHDTLTEDLDLSYRAQIKGWRGVYLENVSVPGELPSTLVAFKRQQRRWARGSSQTARKLASRILRAPASFRQKLASCLHLTSYFFQPFLLGFVLLWPWVLLADSPPSGNIPVWLHLLSTTLALTSVALIAARWDQSRSFAGFTLDVPLALALAIGTSVSNTVGVLQGLIASHRGVFERTPKAMTSERRLELPSCFRIRALRLLVGLDRARRASDDRVWGLGNDCALSRRLLGFRLGNGVTCAGVRGLRLESTGPILYDADSLRTLACGASFARHKRQSVSDPQIPPKATSPWFQVVLIVAAGIVPLCLLVSRSALPPGADPGHLLGLSYALEGHGPEGPLKYPPALPFAMLLLRRFSGGETVLLFGFVKAMGILLLLFEAVGLGAYAGATAGKRAGAWTFMLAALNPNSWNQLLWGGYAQFGAIGAGASALAFLHKGLAAPRHEGTGYRMAAAFLLGCVPLFHLYSVPFFLGASICLCLLHVRGSSGGVVVSRAVTVALISGIVFIPAIPAYANIAGAIDRSPWDPQLHLQSYQIAIAEVAQGIYFHPAVNGLMFVAFVLTIAAGREKGPQWRRCLFPWLLPFVVGSLLLFVLTPPLHAARAGTFLCHAVVLLMGMSLGQRGERNLPWPLLLVLILTPLIDYRDLAAQHSNYAPLGLVETKAMRDLGRTAEGRVWVVSPSPNIDGWWFQGLTGRSTLIGDRLRWYMYSDERIRSVDAQTMLHSSQVLDGGSLRLLNDVETTSLWVHDREEYYPLLQIRCTSSQEAVRWSGRRRGTLRGSRSDVGPTRICWFGSSHFLGSEPAASPVATGARHWTWSFFTNRFDFREWNAPSSST